MTAPRHFLDLTDQPASELRRILDVAARVTGLRRKGVRASFRPFEGKVLAMEGVGDDARAQVAFNRHGTKWLALAVATLTPIE